MGASDVGIEIAPIISAAAKQSGLAERVDALRRRTWRLARVSTGTPHERAKYFSCCERVNPDTFIEVAEDCPAARAEVPPVRDGRPTKAALEYDLIAGEPYGLTQDEVAFRTRVAMRDIPAAEWPAERERFLSQQKPRLQVSALAKRYGWGIHIDSRGRVGLVAVESAEYRRLAADPSLRHVRAFRSKRA